LPVDYNPDLDYGFAWSPLVEPAMATADDREGDLLILNAGSHGLAIRAQDGSIVWGDDRKKGACVSAVPFTHDGQRGVLIVNLADDRSSASFVGINPRTGSVFWRWNGWKEQWGAMGVDPIVHDGRVFVTSAQEYRQAARFTIQGDTLRQDWTTNRVAGYTGSAVLLGTHIYLVDSNGILKCIDWNTGKEIWAQRGFDERGTLIAAEDKLIVQTGASSKLIIAAADPTKYRELRQSQVFNDNPETFTMPVLANGRIYCRSYAGEVVCLELNNLER
jgi:outer membrane protein assembly factor BamB